MNQTTKFCAGLDRGRSRHHVCVLDLKGNILGNRSFVLGGKGLHQMQQWLLSTVSTSAEHAAVGIETSHGPVVETLQSYGFALKALYPHQTDHFRDRFSRSGVKDDFRDAFVIASALRTDPAAFRCLARPDVVQTMLRELVRRREDLDQQKVSLSNQLQDLLWNYFPAVLELASHRLTQTWVLSLLLRAPTPQQASRLCRSSLDKILRANQVRNLKAKTLQENLCQPPLLLTDGTIQAKAKTTQSIAKQLLNVLDLIEQIDYDIAQQIQVLRSESQQSEETSVPTGATTAHCDADILRSMPGVDDHVLAVLFAEAGAELRARNYSALRTLCGVAPITKGSGQNRVVVQRRSVNTLLQNAMFHWASTASQHDPRSKIRYQQLRARDKSRGQALRIVSDRLLNVACAMLKNNTMFVPSSPQE